MIRPGDSQARAKLVAQNKFAPGGEVFVWNGCCVLLGNFCFRISLICWPLSMFFWSWFGVVSCV